MNTIDANQTEFPVSSSVLNAQTGINGMESNQTGAFPKMSLFLCPQIHKAKDVFF